MDNFLNDNDLIIVIDDDICPNNKEVFKFKDLPDNIVHSVANFLELIEDEYEVLTLKDIDNKLKESGKKLEDFIQYQLPSLSPYSILKIL